MNKNDEQKILDELNEGKREYEERASKIFKCDCGGTYEEIQSYDKPEKLGKETIRAIKNSNLPINEKAKRMLLDKNKIVSRQHEEKVVYKCEKCGKKEKKKFPRKYYSR